MSATLANDLAADLLRSFVERLVLLWRERAGVARDLKEARKTNPSGVEGLQREIRLIDADIQKVRTEAAQAGWNTKALEIVARETMETEAQRRKREEFEVIVDLYRKALGLKGRRVG